MSAIDNPKILLIDSYDSFTCNLAALIKSSIPNCSVYIIKNDQFTIHQLLPYLAFFSAVVVGPGPGSPENPADVGVVQDIWRISDEYLLPIFGVCLGLQSLGIAYGACLKRLREVKHGQVSEILHDGTDIFSGVETIHAVRYHSLHIEFPAPNDEIQPLAWADDGTENDQVVMAIKHQSRPFWAVQYHPESICTSGGAPVFENFWRLAKEWSNKRKRRITQWNADAITKFHKPWPDVQIRPARSLEPSRNALHVISDKTKIQHLDMASLCEAFGADEEGSFAFLESAASPGRFSILACLHLNSPQITYHVNDSSVQFTQNGTSVQIPLGDLDIWSWLSVFMQHRKAADGPPEAPFWGGLIGTLSYEVGVHTLGAQISSNKSCSPHPDVNLVYVERSIVVDHKTGTVYVQSLLPNDHTWVSTTLIKINNLASSSTDDDVPDLVPARPSSISIPDRLDYISRIQHAKEYLYSGDSYELCLTARTHITLPQASSWKRYKALRKSNPAPHSAYLRLHPTTFLSSSPERFLSYSRPPGSRCQLRPIKGTVRKGPGITRAYAEEALAGSVKEVAENLMIVDLIRHDLHSVVGEDVNVKQFCTVEEYETVWQLVSVIEGGASSLHMESDENLGWEVLKRSLPPGSMTGAPKKRSVEILDTLEDDQRGLYSGVFGYWCVGGGGDWSVTIRTAYKYEDDSASEAGVENWVLGSGGAITALSEPEAEWDEMLVKLQSVLRSFGASLEENGA